MQVLKNRIKKFVPRPVIRLLRKISAEWKKFIFRGKDVECVICGSEFRQFAGYKKRKNAMCPECGSMERHRLIWLFLWDKINPDKKKGLKILHFAPEKIFFERLSSLEGLEYVPCDINPKIYDYKSPIKVRKVDITDIPFEDNYFDLILCNHVLEHVPDDGKAMNELFRVMNNGGQGIFQVPIDRSREKTYEDPSITSPKEREKAFGQWDHVRYYGLDYKDRLTEAGFEVILDEYAARFDEKEAYRLGIRNTEKIYHCRK